MTDHWDREQQPQYPDQGNGQRQYPPGQPWQPQPYDPGVHQQRIGWQQQAPQGQPPQTPYPQQGQPWPQPGHQPPQGPPWSVPGREWRPSREPAPASTPQREVAVLRVDRFPT